MLQYPNIDPNFFTMGSFSIRWYGVCYLIAFILSYYIAVIKKSQDWNNEQISDLLFYVAVGIIFGGRIGYILFYFPESLIFEPLTIFKFWLPGRSFHGGLLGVILAIIVYAKKEHRSFFSVTDFIAPIVPIGIACGRIGNFINGELWGRVTNVPWGMVFNHVDQFARHPSQIYEFFLEGILLFLILNVSIPIKYVSSKIQNDKTALFLIFYAIFRIFVENYREPDVGQGLIAHYMTMGQVLSIPMLVLGIFLLYNDSRNRVLN